MHNTVIKNIFVNDVDNRIFYVVCNNYRPVECGHTVVKCVCATSFRNRLGTKKRFGRVIFSIKQDGNCLWLPLSGASDFYKYYLFIFFFNRMFIV